MDHQLWNRCRETIRQVQAADLGCRVEDFASNALTVAQRPEKVLYPEYAAMVVSFGAGTVVSVQAPYLEWVNANRPKKHWSAFNAGFLASLGAEVERTGKKVAYHSVANAFTLGEDPVPVMPPPGLALSAEPRSWGLAHRASNEFENAVGESDEDEGFDRIGAFFVVSNAEGVPVAVASAADDGNGCMQIGVHIARAARGLGLARPVVLAASRWILDQGAVPYYSCSAANVRSHLVAESCGYRPLWTVTGIECEVTGVNA